MDEPQAGAVGVVLHESGAASALPFTERPRVGWPIVVVVGLAIILGLSACTPSEPVAAAEGVEWGAEAAQYFEELSRAYRDHDDYRVLDFHTPVAEVERWWRALRGGGRVSDVLRWNSGDLSQDLEALYLSGDEALALITFASEAERAAVVMEIQEDLIAHETVFDLAESLQTGARRDQMILDAYEQLYTEYLSMWSSPDSEQADGLYAPGVLIGDSLFGIETSPESMHGPNQSPGGFAAIATHPEGIVIYLGPGDYGDDPQRAIGAYEVTDEGGCPHLMAVLWQLDGGVIVGEQRYHEIESLRACATDGLPDGWWTGLELPGPSDEVVTGTIDTPAGRTISVHNGTPRLEALVAEGLVRFAENGLAEPQFDSLTFEPTRRCESRTGRVIETNGFRELFLCMYESDICPRAGPCDRPALTARMAVLHELGHAWMIDHVDGATEARLLEASGRISWGDPDVSWEQRGVEYAAEVMAWGLAPEEVTMVRIGSPACEVLTDVFAILTTTTPSRTGGSCPG